MDYDGSQGCFATFSEGSPNYRRHRDRLHRPCRSAFRHDSAKPNCCGAGGVRPLAERLANEFHVSVAMENDADAVALSESLWGLD